MGTGRRRGFRVPAQPLHGGDDLACRRDRIGGRTLYRVRIGPVDSVDDYDRIVDALAKIADHQPDVIFVDIVMPRLDGYQTCALIKKSPKFCATPVVMLSSKDGLFDRARGRMVGSNEYLTKPFTKESLLRAVADHVAPRAGAPSPRRTGRRRWSRSAARSLRRRARYSRSRRPSWRRAGSRRSPAR